MSASELAERSTALRRIPVLVAAISGDGRYIHS